MYYINQERRHYKEEKRTVHLNIPLGSSVSKRIPVSTVQHRATFSFVYPPPPVTCSKKVQGKKNETISYPMDRKNQYQCKISLNHKCTNKGKLNFFTNLTHSACPARNVVIAPQTNTQSDPRDYYLNQGDICNKGMSNERFFTSRIVLRKHCFWFVSTVKTQTWYISHNPPPPVYHLNYKQGQKWKKLQLQGDLHHQWRGWSSPSGPQLENLLHIAELSHLVDNFQQPWL